MSKLAGLGAPIPEEKLRGLREALEVGRQVRFKNGSTVELQTCENCAGTGRKAAVFINEAQIAASKPCPTCGGEKLRLLVIRPAGGVARYRLDTELRSAYAMALRGPQPKRQPTGDGSRFGDDPPW